MDPPCTSSNLGRLDDRVRAVIERIHASPTQLAMVVTGGAVHAPTWLLSVPGASRTVLDVRIPYSHESLAALIRGSLLPGGNGQRKTLPEKSVSRAMAEAMADAAFREATNLSPFGTPVLGVGVTCALATDRDRRGEDQAFICTKDSSGTVTVRQHGFEKGVGALSRTEQDTLASAIVVDEIARCVDRGIQDEHTREAIRMEAIRKLLDGSVQTVEFSGGHVFLDAPRRNRIYLPGSFNPLHDGHTEMLEAAKHQGNDRQEAAFELSVQNADKGLLDASEIARRVAQFTRGPRPSPVVLTRAPLFTTKAGLFPGSCFVVGYDTAIRLVQQRYYGDSASEMVREFSTLVQRGCSFLVAGRVDKDTGAYMSLKDISIPDPLAGMQLFVGMSEAAFRKDISSTELRELRELRELGERGRGE